MHQSTTEKERKRHGKEEKKKLIKTKKTNDKVQKIETNQRKNTRQRES